MMCVSSEEYSEILFRIQNGITTLEEERARLGMMPQNNSVSTIELIDNRITDIKENKWKNVNDVYND